MKFDFKNVQTPITLIEDNVNSIFVMREDLLPFSFGGNNVRIALEFINDMYEKKMDCIVGYGNARSNLSGALANLCAHYNIPCHIISPADDNEIRIHTYNRKIVGECNAVFHYCSKQNVAETVENVLCSLKKNGMRPYYIYGNSFGEGNEHIPLGAYANVYEQIKNKFDYVFLATGTGMTQGGLLIGKAKNSGKEKIVGISVARSSEQEIKVLENMINAYCKKVEDVQVDEIIVDDKFLCGGYGKYGKEIEQTISRQLVKNGLPLDPTYTGKAFWGMMEYLTTNCISDKKVLFIHTGGSPLFFDYQNEKIKLCRVEDCNEIFTAVSKLESCLSPTVVEQGIDVWDYSKKLCKYGIVWCHYDEGIPVSIVTGYCNDFVNHTAYLSVLAVDSNYRRRNLGQLLLEKFENTAKQFGMKSVKLRVRKKNTIAQTLYKKNGYCFLQEAPDNSFYYIKTLVDSK